MNEALKRLIEERTSLAARLGTLLAENRSLGKGEEFDTVSAQVDDLDTRIAGLKKQIEAGKVADEARSMLENVVSPAEARKFEAEDDSALMRRLFAESGSAEFERRVMKTTTTNAGAELVKTTFANELIRVAQDESQLLQLARVIVTSDGGDYIVPVVSGTSTTSLVGEGDLIPASDVATANTRLRAYKYATRTEYSSELAQDSVVDMAALVAADHGISLGRKVSEHLAVGTGTNQPQGLFTGGASAGLTGFALDSDGIVDLSASVATAYGSKAVWVLKPSNLSTLRKLKDGEGRSLWNPSLSTAASDTLVGRPVVTEPNAPANKIGFGSVADALTVRQIGSVRVDSSIHASFANDLVQVRTIARLDAKVTNPAAFKVATIA